MSNLAKEQRDKWLEKSRSGDISDLHYSIQLFRKLHEDEYWRGSSFFEQLGVAAIALEELLDKKERGKYV